MRNMALYSIDQLYIVTLLHLSVIPLKLFPRLSGNRINACRREVAEGGVCSAA